MVGGGGGGFSGRRGLNFQVQSINYVNLMHNTQLMFFLILIFTAVVFGDGDLDFHPGADNWNPGFCLLHQGIICRLYLI